MRTHGNGTRIGQVTVSVWAPWDTSLYWLLAELYAARGSVRPADVIFFQCVNSRQYSNRQLLMEHRRVVAELAERARRSAPIEATLFDDGPPEQPAPKDGGNFLPSRDKVIAFGAVFAVVALVLLALQFRAIGRKLRGCGPSG